MNNFDNIYKIDADLNKAIMGIPNEPVELQEDKYSNMPPKRKEFNRNFDKVFGTDDEMSERKAVRLEINRLLQDLVFYNAIPEDKFKTFREQLIQAKNDTTMGELESAQKIIDQVKAEMKELGVPDSGDGSIKEAVELDADDLGTDLPAPKSDPISDGAYAFKLGFAAHDKKRPFTANPYKGKDEKAAKSWDRGWKRSEELTVPEPDAESDEDRKFYAKQEDQPELKDEDIFDNGKPPMTEDSSAEDKEFIDLTDLESKFCSGDIKSVAKTLSTQKPHMVLAFVNHLSDEKRSKDNIKKLENAFIAINEELTAAGKTSKITSSGGSGEDFKTSTTAPSSSDAKVPGTSEENSKLRGKTKKEMFPNAENEAPALNIHGKNHPDPKAASKNKKVDGGDSVSKTTEFPKVNDTAKSDGKVPKTAEENSKITRNESASGNEVIKDMNDKKELEDSDSLARSAMENYVNGNLSDCKDQIKQMTKYGFLEFIEKMRGQGVKPYQLYSFVKGLDESIEESAISDAIANSPGKCHKCHQKFKYCQCDMEESATGDVSLEESVLHTLKESEYDEDLYARPSDQPAVSAPSTTPTAPVNYADKSLSELASIIERDWRKQGKGVNYAARPYLDALSSMDKITDNYGADDGRSIVAYFLSNASSWKGSVAAAVKTELKKRLKNR